MGRLFDRTLECGCMISSDGGGALIDCYSDDCKYAEWMKTKDYRKFLKECKEKN